MPRMDADLTAEDGWLGLDWVRYVLKRNLDFEPVFRFQFSESFGDVR